METRKLNAYVAPGVVRRSITLSQVNRIVKAKTPEWLMEHIVNTVCAVTGVEPRQVYSRSRISAVAQSRHLVRFYISETLLHLISMNAITMFVTKGRNNDHSIVLRSQKIIKTALEGRDEWAKQITEYVHKIDSQLNQLHVDESNSTNG